MLISLDLETTGINPQSDQILQIAAIAFDPEDLTTEITKLPTYNFLVKHNKYYGDAFALQLNQNLLFRLAKGEGTPEDIAIQQLETFVKDTCPGNKPTAIGFNVAAFDIAFLKTANCNPFHYRGIELGSLFCSPAGIPASSDILIKKILGKEASHTALEDAQDNILLWRAWKKGLCP